MSCLHTLAEKLGPDILEHTYEHIYLTYFAMLAAAFIGLSLGVYLTRCPWPRAAGLVLGLAGVVQTVPSLALIAFIVLIFGLLAMPTIGFVPALVALVLYALLPILRNTYTGIRQVDSSVIEVARGMGMTSGQILFQVELPLSLPVIMAGVRISTVWTIGVACLCSLVGGGGLGDLIMQGLRSMQSDYMLAGTLPAALLAIVFDGLLARSERWLTPAGLTLQSAAQGPVAAHEPAHGMRTSVKVLVLAGLLAAAAAALVFAQPLLAPRAHNTAQGARITAAFDAEFHTRPDGYRGLCEHYDLAFSNEPVQMEPGLMYKAAADGTVDVIDGFATDGRIPAYDLFVLEDDQRFFPPYYAAPVVRAETLETHPELRGILNRLAGKIDNAAMQRLNFEMDEKGRKAKDVAREFLETEQLIEPSAAPGSGHAGRIRVGGKQFTEQEILGETMAQLIECSSNLAVERRLNLGGTMICFNALKAGDLDLYAEYTGTGLVSILKRDVITEPRAAYDAVAKAFADQFGLVWLEPFGFNNTYTLTMRKAQADALGIASISDLARVLRDE